MYDARGRICVHRYAGHVFYILHVEVNMVTKYKAAVFIIAAMFSSIASAAYTTMTIEGVKQANGVWTAAGVMDTQGFVRTTGAVSVMGTTRNLPVAMKYSAARLGPLVGGAARLAGPVGWAASVGLWLADGGISSTNDKFIAAPISGSRPFVVSKYCGISSLGMCDYPISYPCAAGGQRLYGQTTLYMGNQWFSGEFCRITYDPKTDPDFFSNAPTEEQWKAALSRPIGLPAAFDAMKHPSMAGKPIPIESTSFTPYSEWYGDPYFKDGNWYRDRVDISPCPTASQPTRVCVDIGPQKFEGSTDPQTVPSQATSTATGSTPKEQADFCKKNPHSIACAEFGELEDEQLDVEERPVDVSYTPWGSSTSQCPADKVIPLWDEHSLKISYSPVCQFASLLRPLVIALAFVAAGFIVAGITRKGAES